MAPVDAKAGEAAKREDVVVMPRDMVMRMATHVAIMYEQWPVLVQQAKQVKNQQIEHERRLMQLEKYLGANVMKNPVLILKLVVYVLVMGFLYWLGASGKLDATQTASDMTVASAVLIAALGLKGAADSFGATVAKYLQPLLALLSGNAQGGGQVPPAQTPPPAPAPSNDNPPPAAQAEKK